MNKKIVGILIVGLFIGISCFPNIIGTMPLNNNINQSKSQLEIIMCSKDSYISYDSDDNHGSENWLFASQDSGNWIDRSYLFFDLSSIHPYKNIKSATLKLYGGSNNSLYPGYIYFYAVNDDWNEYTIHYYNAPGWHSSPIASTIFTDDSWISIDVTPFVNDWMTGIKTNYGFVFMTSGSLDVYAGVSSREAGFSKRPRLEIEYENILPTVNIISPNSGDTVNGIITIEGEADDAEAYIQYVQIRINDGDWEYAKCYYGNCEQWNYSFDTTQVNNGDCRIYARSYDNTDYSEIDELLVNVQNPPVLDSFLMCEWVEGCNNYGPELLEFFLGETCYCYINVSDVDIGDVFHTRWKIASEVKYTSDGYQTDWSGSGCLWFSWNPDEIGEWLVDIFCDNVYFGSSPVFKIIANQYEIHIDSISGGFGINVFVNNTGLDDAFNVNWSVDVYEDFAFILSGSHTEGIIDELESGNSITIQSKGLRGIGFITISVQVADSVKQATAFLLGPLVLRVVEV